MASTFTTISTYAAEAPTNNATVNSVVKELYLEGDESIISSLLANKASVIIIHHPTPDTDQLYIGIATNAGWTAQSVICACQFDPEAARDALVLPMVPQNNSGVHGYMVLDFPVTSNGNVLQWQDISIYQNNVELNGAVIQRQCWPTIAAWFESGYICVDQKNGRDYYTGTENFPVGSIARAMKMSKRVKLKRSQQYYGRLELDGYEIDAYGMGTAPELCGMITPKEPLHWERGSVVNNEWGENPSGKVWRLDLKDPGAFQGYAPANDSELNIGTIVNISTGQTLNCRKCYDLEQLKNDYDIFQPFPVGAKDFQYLYLYLNSGTPDSYNWAFTAGANGVKMKNSTLRNIAVRYWGKHGIAVGTNNLINSCSVDCIGGSQMLASDGIKACAYGNGIEIWINPGSTVNDVTVKNCRITRCYDAGLTFQGRYNTGQLLPNAINIMFTDNYVSNCGYGLEIWDTPSDGTTFSSSALKNCRITGCTFAYCGYNTGFQQFEPEGYFRINCLLNNGFRKKVDCTIDSCTFEYAPAYIRQKALVNGTIVRIDEQKSRAIDAETITLRNNRINMRANEELMHIQYGSQQIVPADSTGVAQYRQADADTTSTISIIGDDGAVQIFGPIF